MVTDLLNRVFYLNFFIELKLVFHSLFALQVNKISYWTFQKNDEEELCPVSIASQTVFGDVTEIRFIGRDEFVSSSSHGTVKVFKLQDDPFCEIKEVNSWDGIHKFK